MITHECLPINPQDGDTFCIPEDIQVHIGAFIRIHNGTELIGEASAFNKVPVMSNLWTLHRVITPSSVNLAIDTEVKVITILKRANKVRFEDGFGWYVSEYDKKPLEETVYEGKVASRTGPVFAAGNYCVYELLGFRVIKKEKKNDAAYAPTTAPSGDDT